MSIQAQVVRNARPIVRFALIKPVGRSGYIDACTTNDDDDHRMKRFLLLRRFSAGLGLARLIELDDENVSIGVADVFSDVRVRVRPHHVSGLELARHGFPTGQCQLPFESAARHDHDVRVRMHRRFISRFVAVLENAHALSRTTLHLSESVFTGSWDQTSPIVRNTKSKQVTTLIIRLLPK